MEVYSHRGIGLGKENSKASIQEAKKRTLKYEADVRKSADKQLVLWHDRGFVENKPYSELKKLGIVRLEDALQMGIDLDLDIKEGVNGPEVLNMVEQHNMVEHVIFTSFFPNKVIDIKKKNKEATVGFITQIRLPRITLPFLARAGMDYILPHADKVTGPFVQSAHKSGMKVVTWCPSNETIMQNNISYGIDGFILNNAVPLAL